MYANETKSGFVKVYPNKAAIKQMALKSMTSAAVGKAADKTHTVMNGRCDITQGLPSREKLTSECSSLSKSEQAFNDDFYTVLLILLLLCSSPDSENSMFTLVMSCLFLD